MFLRTYPQAPLRVFARRNYFSIRDMLFGTNEPKFITHADGLPRCNYQAGRYISPWTKSEKDFKIVLKWLLTRKQNRLRLTAKGDENSVKVQSVDKHKILQNNRLHATWMGHASCYVYIDGLRILTDPVWSERCSPSQYFGPKRTISPPIEVEELVIDVVLLSHTHYDHLDVATVERIGNKPLWIVPMGVKALLLEFGISNCVELNWWDKHQVQVPSPLVSSNATTPATTTIMTTSTSPRTIDITFTPTHHWTSRTFFNKNTCLWGSFAVVGPTQRFFFTGDTAYCNVFKKIGELFGPFDLAAVPIGAYKPRWFMKDVHCNPAEAVRIHQDLKAKKSMAIHWATFPLADEDFVEPALELARVRELAHVSHCDFFTMLHGETYQAGDEPQNDLSQYRPDLVAAYKKYCVGKHMDDE